ncbi:MAG: EamA family transporter [Actinomycetota bacterium]|nr:EamA family transporter [Actinomycetota bacterium]
MVQQERATARSRAPLGLAAIALAAALWALGAVIAADLFADGVPPLELAEARSVVSALGLALLPAAWRRPPLAPAAAVRRSLVTLGVCIGLVNAVYYVAIERLPVAVALVLQYTAPALVVVYSALRLRKKPGNDVMVAVVLALAGVALVSGLVGAEVAAVDGLGILMGLASAVLFATYTLVGAAVVRTYGPVGAMFRAFSIAGALWICWQSLNGFPIELFEPANLPRVILVGVVATLTPFLLYLWGVERVKAERAAIAATLEPVLGALVAWIFLNQSLSAVQLVGGALVVGAVVLIQMSRAAPPAPEL